MQTNRVLKNGTLPQPSVNGVSHAHHDEERPKLSTCSTPTPRHTVLWFVRLTGNEREKFVCYSPQLRGFFTHWTGKKTVACFEDRSLCEGGHKEETVRENFYVHAWSMKLGKQVFVYLTPSAAEEMEMQAGKNKDWKGLQFDVFRTPSDKGRLHVHVQGHSLSIVKQGVPPEVDAYDSIMRFLKTPDSDRKFRRSLASYPQPESDVPEE
jgi:hypothetical protein